MSRETQGLRQIIFKIRATSLTSHLSLCRAITKDCKDNTHKGRGKNSIIEVPKRFMTFRNSIGRSTFCIFFRFFFVFCSINFLLFLQELDTFGFVYYCILMVALVFPEVLEVLITCFMLVTFTLDIEFIVLFVIRLLYAVLVFSTSSC